MNHTLIHHFLEKSAEKYPDKIAIIHDNTRSTYDRINIQANKIATWMLKNGIRQGDRVALFMENRLEYVISYYAVLKTGAVVVPLSYDLKPGGLFPLIEEIEPTFIIVSEKYKKYFEKQDSYTVGLRALIISGSETKWEKNHLQIISWEEILDSKEGAELNEKIDESSLATIIYTSGSTGKPKGVMLSHKNIVANIHSICQYLKLTDHDIQLVVLPFYYVFGKSLLNTLFAVGGSIVINNKIAYPAAVIKQMISEKVTGFSGVPSTYAFLLNHSSFEHHRGSLSHLRYCTQAGGHMPLKTKKKLRHALPDHTDIYIMYGATEASARLTYLSPEQYEKKPDSIGQPIPGVKINIIDPAGKYVSQGQTGELVAAGDNIMMGYWKDPETTEKVLDNQGNYHTGDMGYMDSIGDFFLTGRKDRQLKVKGNRVNPKEIEDVLLDMEPVLEAAVFGMEDEEWGNKIAAVISLNDKKTSLDSIIKQCTEKMPKYKVPSVIKIENVLPKYSNGKIDIEKCRSLIKFDGYE